MTRLVLLLCASVSLGMAPGQERPPEASPASTRPPRTAKPQSYPAEQIATGQSRFAARCGFCHGRDAQGGESGTDLTRSSLVADDVRGDKIKPVVWQGRPDKGMPAIALTDADMAAIVAFIHDAVLKADTAKGGRRSVDADDLQTGDAAAGQRYFDGAGGCAACHPIAGTFATVGSRYQGLALLQRMLYPGSGRDAGPPPPPATVTVTTSAGQVVSGKLAYRDEFTISVVDADGWTRSWPITTVRISANDPLHAHSDHLSKYTDDDMHNVLAYLRTLR